MPLTPFSSRFSRTGASVVTTFALARATLVILTMALLAVCPAMGEELFLGVAGNYTFNSNYFSSANNTDEANSFQIGPTVQLNDPDGRFRYEIGYDGAYQAYADQDGVNAWESRLRARATFDLTTRTRIRITERFRDISNLRFSRQDIALADTALDPNQNRYFRNEVELELIHDVTELLQVRLRAEHNWIDFEENNDRSDSTAWEGAGELRYQIASEHFVGAGASYTHQEFDQSLTELGSTGQYVTAFATWIWNVTDAVTFTANGGPSYVHSDEDDQTQIAQTQFVGGRLGGDIFRADFASCDGGLASLCDFASVAPIPAADLGTLNVFPLAAGNRVGSDSTLTFFGGAAIAVDVAEWNFDLSYQRRQSTTSGDGLASSLDRLAMELEFAPPKWRSSVFVAASWDRRETLTDSTVIDFNVVAGPGGAAQRNTALTRVESDSTVRDNYTVIAGYRYRLEDNFAGTLDGRYRRTEIDDPNRSRPGIDTFFVVLTFEYTLDPIAF